MFMILIDPPIGTPNQLILVKAKKCTSKPSFDDAFTSMLRRVRKPLFFVKGFQIRDLMSSQQNAPVSYPDFQVLLKN